MTTTNQMRIYVASLSDYNAGILHGRWIDLPSTAREINDEIQEMLTESKQENAEEWSIHDYDNFPSMGENPDLDELVTMAEALEEHGDAFRAWMDNSSSNRDVSDFEEQFMGEHSSLADYIQDFWEESGFKAEAWPHPTNYIDWDRLAHDWEVGGDVWTAPADGGVYVFNNH